MIHIIIGGAIKGIVSVFHIILKIPILMVFRLKEWGFKKSILIVGVVGLIVLSYLIGK